MEFKDIKRIVELMDDHGLTHFKLELDQSKLELRKGSDLDIDAVRKLMSLAPSAVAPAYGPPAPAPTASAGSEPAADAGGGMPAGEVEIKSELVGTFYSSPSPDEGPFVKVGSEVDDDTVVCIVEAMKVMNQIQAGISGKITKILIDNGSLVQYGDPLFHVKTS